MIKKLQKTVTALSLLCYCYLSQGQYYRFEKQTAAYQEISGGTLITNTFTNEAYLVNLPVSLTLFDKVLGKKITAGINGFVVGTGPTNSFATDPLLFGLNPIDNSSSLMATALPDGTGDTVVIIQWKNLIPDSANAGDYVNFQCRIYAHSQVVEFAYGPSIITTPKYLNGTAEISAGIFLLSTDFNTTYDVNMLHGEPASVRDTSNANADVYLRGVPPNGTVYRFIKKSNVSVPEISKDLISVYPVPAQDYLTLHADNSVKEKIKSVSVVNSLGQEIPGFALENDTVNLAALAPGVYFLEIDAAEYSTILKFIKQ